MVQGRDFVLLPETLWKTLHQWYGGAPALPRQVGLVTGNITYIYKTEKGLIIYLTNDTLWKMLKISYKK